MLASYIIGNVCLSKVNVVLIDLDMIYRIQIQVFLSRQFLTSMIEDGDLDTSRSKKKLLYPGLHTGFSVWGGRCVWVNWMGEYFSQVTPRNGAKSIVVSFC